MVQSFISLSVRAHHHHLWKPLLAQALELETKVIRRFPNISLLGAFSIVSIDVKLGSRRQKYYKGRATIRQGSAEAAACDSAPHRCCLSAVFLCGGKKPVSPRPGHQLQHITICFTLINHPSEMQKLHHLSSITTPGQQRQEQRPVDP